MKRFSPRAIDGATSRILLVVGHEWEIGVPLEAWPPT
jgi:hypothetical protein